MSTSQGEGTFRSGFISIVGRPNVGKSTLLNSLLDEKVSITAASPNTTRTAVRGVLHGEGFQAVFVDTPGLHKARTALGRRLNETAGTAMSDVDCTVLVIDGASGLGRGDQFVASRLPPDTVVAINKADLMSKEAMLKTLDRAVSTLELCDAEYFPISARSKRGVGELLSHLVSRLPPGPAYYEKETISDTEEAAFVAELVREQLLRVACEELPHSIACQVTELDWPYIRCEVIVERDSQRAIILGKGGLVLKGAGIAARAQLPPGTYLDLHVRVEPGWQKSIDLIERFGY